MFVNANAWSAFMNGVHFFVICDWSVTFEKIERERERERTFSRERERERERRKTVIH